MSNTQHAECRGGLEECHKPSGKFQGISHCLESGHPATDCYAFGKFAAEHGITKTSNEYKQHNSSVNKLKQLYLQKLEEGDKTTEIHHGHRGRPLKLEDLYG